MYGVKNCGDEEVLGKESSFLRTALRQAWSPGLTSSSCTLRGGVPTCVAHEVVVRSVEEALKATGVIPWSWVATELVFWSWVGVTAEVSGLKGGLCLHAGVTARLDF